MIDRKTHPLKIGDDSTFQAPMLRSKIYSNEDIINWLMDSVRGNDDSEAIFGAMIDAANTSTHSGLVAEFQHLGALVTDRDKVWGA